MPPRPSTADLISSLLYLQPEFDPATLTVAQLTGLLQAHNIDTRPASNKAGLVALFNTQIAANRDVLLERRRREQAKSPRANGIRDGMTGQLVDASVEDSPAGGSGRGGRRSSAAPTPASTSRRRTARLSTTGVPTPADDGPSEPEVTPPSSTQERLKRGPDEPAFTRENIFQKGSSSPDPPAPAESSSRRRSRAPETSDPDPSSAPHRRTRHSMIAEGGMVTDSPNNPFSTAASSAAGYARRAYNAMTSSDPAEEEPKDMVLSPEELDAEEADALIPYPISERQPLLRLSTVVPLLVSILLGLIVFQFAISSSKLGFCDQGRNTNVLLEQRLEQLELGEKCLALGGENCPPIPFLPRSMQALSCTPCPEKATCAIRSLACDAPLIVKPHAFSVLNPILDGFPGLGPIAFPPTCVEDESRKKLLTNAGRWIIERLQKHRGDQVCQDKEPRATGPTPTLPGDEHSPEVLEMWQWAALRKPEMRHLMGETQEGKRMGSERLDEVFAGAMEQLEEMKYVLSGRDEDGEEWVAAKQARMSSACRLRVWTRELWRKARLWLLLLSTVIAGLLYARRQLFLRRQTTALAHSLLPSILSVLQRSPLPVLSTQLRDSVLSYEPNLKRRKEIWERVEKIVEMNANIRVGEEEVGGEVGRGWRWVGPPAIEGGQDGTLVRRELKY